MLVVQNLSSSLLEGFTNTDRTSVKLMSHLQNITKLTKWKSDKN